MIKLIVFVLVFFVLGGCVLMVVLVVIVLVKVVVKGVDWVIISCDEVDCNCGCRICKVEECVWKECCK